MSRCQHCNKLTHSEDLEVFFDLKDYGKIQELMSLIGWTSKYMYYNPEVHKKNEFGKLKCGDIYIHFISLDQDDESNR